MKKPIVFLLALAFGAGALIDPAQAARLGGGRSLGTQRQLTTTPRQATPPTQPQQPAAAAQAAGANRWLAPLAGLAAGLGLGWLFAQGGFGAAVGALLMALLAGAAAFALARLWSGSRTQAQPVRYASLGSETLPSAPQSQIPGDVAGHGSDRGLSVANVPPGFDAEGFLAEAKRNFLRLQEANDRRDLDLLREVTTEEMFEALKGGAVERAEAPQTDVVTLKAALLEIVTERDLHWASVRFSGSIREEARASAGPFEEIWHLQKPVNGSSGWLLAGIQQLS